MLARVHSVNHIRTPNAQWGKAPRRGSERLEVIVTDGYARLMLVFFGKGANVHERQLREGRLGLFAGTVTRFRHQWQLVHPEYEILPDYSMDEKLAAEHAADYASELHPGLPGQRQDQLLADLPCHPQGPGPGWRPSRTHCRRRCATGTT